MSTIVKLCQECGSLVVEMGDIGVCHGCAQVRKGDSIVYEAPRGRYALKVAQLFLLRPNAILTTGDISDWLYGDDDRGGPDSSELCIRRFIITTRDVLGRVGLRIVNHYGRRYHLEVMPEAMAA